MQKFDPDLQYIKRWVPEFGKPSYPQPIVNHEQARIRCLDVYKTALSG
jgi:deoxyribodipyrimidine photo-lyase